MLWDLKPSTVMKWYTTQSWAQLTPLSQSNTNVSVCLLWEDGSKRTSLLGCKPTVFCIISQVLLTGSKEANTAGSNFVPKACDGITFSQLPAYEGRSVRHGHYVQWMAEHAGMCYELQEHAGIYIMYNEWQEHSGTDIMCNEWQEHASTSCAMNARSMPAGTSCTMNGTE